MKNIKRYFIPLIVALSMLLSACGGEDNAPEQEKVSKKPAAEKEVTNDLDSEEAEGEKLPDGIQKSSINLSDIPEYTGTPYVAVNGNIPDFDDADMITDSFELYSELDSLGRCGAAYANVGTDLMPTEERGNISQVKPTGWQAVEYDNVDGRYLYNRCHLIGYQLTAENANEKNLITGTRYMNVDGMLPFENMVADYVKETGCHVLYRVTPVFDGDYLVASGVQMEAKSVEDDGEGVLFNVFCYNVQPDITINYATGESSPVVAEPQTPEPEAEYVPEQAPVSSEHIYILNTNTGKFHYATCRDVGKMKDENKQEYTGSRDDIINQGYEACKHCNP